MHDRDVVAFDIKRPWPKKRNDRGWRHWPALVTVWHREPGGADSLTVCRRSRVPWQLHVHHWRLQFPPLQHLRRRLLTRCEWCGGRSRKGDPVDCSHSWDGPRGHWWQGEPGLFHSDCSGVDSAHRTCTCPDPLTEHGDQDRGGWGECALCGRFRAWSAEPNLERLAKVEAVRALVPVGGDYERIREWDRSPAGIEYDEVRDRFRDVDDDLDDVTSEAMLLMIVALVQGVTSRG